MHGKDFFFNPYSLGLILVIAIPLLALNASSAISLIQEMIQVDLKDILTGLIAKL